MEDKINKLINSIERLIQVIEYQTSTNVNTEDKLMSAKDISESDEFEIGYRTALKLFDKPDFPVVKYGKKKKVLRSKLINYIAHHPILNK